MADKSSIEWTDATWNIITGCTLVDDGCRNCYAAHLIASWPAIGNHPSRKGLARKNASGGAKFTGEVRFNEQWLDQPLRWKKPRRIFVCAHGDLFHESVPDEWIDRVFAVMALAPQHTFQVLTKRPERARDYLTQSDQRGRPRYWSIAALMAATGSWSTGAASAEKWPLPNVWLGTSASDQASADLRIPPLLHAPAAVRFLSDEPLLGQMDLTPWLDPDEFCEGCDDGDGYGNRCGRTDIPREQQCPWGRAVQIVTEHGPFGPDGEPHTVTSEVRKLDWVIVGGESGPHARPMHPDWARSLRDQCVAAGVPFFFKQWGEWAPHTSEIEDAEGSIKTSPRNGVNWHSFDGGVSGVFRVGKARAGRTLDGRTWDQMPGVADG